MAFRVLFVEDSKEITDVVSDALKRDCIITVAESLKRAKESLLQNTFDLVLLDLTLPDGNGIKLCSYIRQSESLRNLPVIFLTGSGEIEDKELAFTIGADDYLVKPVNLRELRARVIGRLQRSQKQLEENLHIGNLRLNVPLQQVVIFKNGGDEILDITPLEFKMLYFFSKQEARVFSRDQLISAVWGENVHLLERTVDTHISHLRKKMQLANSSHKIEPVRGMGYRFVSAKAAANSKRIA